MELTLVINPGSTSKKYGFYEDDICRLVVKYEKTSKGLAECVRINSEQQRCGDVVGQNYENTLEAALAVAKNKNILDENSVISNIGIRIVAPGEMFTMHQIIDEVYLKAFEEKKSVAPLHIPPIISEIYLARELLPDIQMIAVSDSAFHTTIPEFRRNYSLEGMRERDIKRYGYHGISVASTARRLKDTFENVVVLHVGGGVSATAVKNGKSIATTMGYTPVSGLIMGSRGGDLDPGALIEFLKRMDLYGEEAHTYIQTHGGFAGMTGLSDMRVVLELEAKGNKKAADAMNLFVENIKQAILAYSVSLGDLDAIVLTGTAMERNSDLRTRIVADIPYISIEIDSEKNEQALNDLQTITSLKSKLPVLVMRTGEMNEIATVTQGLIKTQDVVL